MVALASVENHGLIRRTLRARKLIALPAIDVPSVREAMDRKALRLPAGEGECELRVRRKEIDKALLNDVAAFLVEQCIYPYSVHLPAFDLGGRETTADVIRSANMIVEAIDPLLFVLHVSGPVLDVWGPAFKDVLAEVPRVIALENVGVRGNRFRFPDRVNAILDSVGEPSENLAFCLDTTHVVPLNAGIGSRDDWEKEIIGRVFEFIRVMGSRLKHIHLSNTRYEGERRAQHLPINDGFLDMEQIKNALRFAKFDGKVVLEVPRNSAEAGIGEWNRL